MEPFSIYTQSFFDWLLRSTIQASIVICLILLIQAALRNKLTARWHYAFWLILVVRMVLPWAPQSRFSIYNFVVWQIESNVPVHVMSERNAEPAKTPGESLATRQTTVHRELTGGTDGQTRNWTVSTRTPRESVDAATQPWLRLSGVLPFLWLAGAFLLGGYIIICNLKLWRAASVECPSTDKETLKLLEECRTAIGLRIIVPLIPSEKVNTPILMGFIRPRLLIPGNITEKLTREELRYVFLHELGHVKRHDIALGWVTALLQVLHWFNPVVWLAFHRMRSNRESACDALVLSRMQCEGTQNYGLAIVSLLEHFSVPQPLPGLAGIVESKSQLKRRIAMITKFRNNSYRWSPLATILLVILACISLPDAEHTRASETAASQTVNPPKFTKIRIPNEISWDAQLSPDGKNIAFVLEGKLWIMPRSGKLGPDYPGTPRQLDTGSIEVYPAGFAWSHDGRWIAFTENDYLYGLQHQGNQRMYVISVEGGKPKEVCESDHNFNSRLAYGLSLSPNGKTLAFLASSVDANEVQFHTYTISVDGGVPKRLLDTSAREPVFSPDGKKIAYVAGKLFEPQGAGLWVVLAEGGIPRLVANASCATSPVWSPDMRMIAFLDYRDSKAPKQINIVRISQDGERTEGRMTVNCPEGIQGIRSLIGWTPDNKIGVIVEGSLEYGLYTLPTKGGSATLVARGELAQPRWSPDGKRIVCSNRARGDWDGWIYYGTASVPAEGGGAVTIPIQLGGKIAKPGYGAGNHVSPDGKTIIFAGASPPRFGPGPTRIWTLPIEGGEPSQLTNAPASLTDRFPCWSPDGKAIAFIRTKESANRFESIAEVNIFIIPADGGPPRQLTSKSDRVSFGSIAWSPDGKWLAYCSTENPSADVVTLKVIPSEGGESCIVGKMLPFDAELAWSPDSKRIAFNDGNNKVIKILLLGDGSTMDIDPHLTKTSIYHLDWSRDGEQLVFAGSQGGGPEFWMIENFLPDQMGK